MSATIIRIMTSSSPRNTEQPTGRVAVMMESLPAPTPKFANYARRCNVIVTDYAICKWDRAPLPVDTMRLTAKQGSGSTVGTRKEQKFHLDRQIKWQRAVWP